MGVSSIALTTFETVLTINFIAIAEQVPKRVGLSIATVTTGNGRATVMTGSNVANISVGTFVLKNRWVGSMDNCCKRRPQFIPTETVIEKFDIEQTGSAPRSAVLLASNKRLHGNLGTSGKEEVEVMVNASRVESH